MNYILLLAPLALEVACIVHAVRNGRVFPWVYVIVFLPLVGCIAYFAVEIAPGMLSGRAAHTVRSNVRNWADPHRNLRERLREVELVGSVDAKRALAEEYVRRGLYGEAVDIYRNTLAGQFRNDPALLLGLARAQFLSGDGAGAQASLDSLQAADPNFVSADAHLLYARCLEAQNELGEAQAEYEKLVRYFPGEEARCRYAMLLEKLGSLDKALELYSAVLNSLEGAPSHYRKVQRQWGEAARAGVRQAGRT